MEISISHTAKRLQADQYFKTACFRKRGVKNLKFKEKNLTFLSIILQFSSKKLKIEMPDQLLKQFKEYQTIFRTGILKKIMRL